MSPRFILKVGDTIMDWCAWEFEHNGLNEAGVLHVRVPVTADKWAWWTQQTEIIVDAYIGYPADPHNYSAADLVHMMRARIDTLEFDLGHGLITMSGRDLTSLLIDVKSDAKYPNQTASQIAQQLAQQVGLKAQVQPTTTLVGTYYSADHVLLQREETLWTLLTYLAQHEGVQCFVLGDTLYFGDYATLIGPGAYPIGVTAPGPNAYPVANAESLVFSHDLTLAQDVAVTVRSYHGQKNARFQATATLQQKKTVAHGSIPITPTQTYTYIIPGLDLQGCQQKAQQYLQQITQHEYRVSATLPGGELFYPWTPIVVSGTGTPFDATYTVERIRRSFDPASKRFECQFSAKTQPAQPSVSLS